MTVLVQTVRHIRSGIGDKQARILRRVAPVATILAVISVIPNGWSSALNALSDAYLSVSVFVAGTLALVYAAEHGFKTDLGYLLMRYRHWQVPAGALLGAFPGCGGAIVAMTQYIRGYLSFGGVVATLTATMGDAMFLLLAKEPMTGLGILTMGVVVGTVSGYLVDAIHGPDFMRPHSSPAATSYSKQQQGHDSSLSTMEKFWVVLMVPGVFVGVLAAFQVDFNLLVSTMIPGEPDHWLGVAGAVLAIIMWIRSEDGQEESPCTSGDSCNVPDKSVIRRVMSDTNFITAWVVSAFVGYELVVAVFGIDLGAGLTVWAPLVPAVAILVGFIPGCGPQILVTSLYISGALPLSAQLGNAISNDGDALFPAIAVAPKAALVATIYSAIPAIIVGYGWYLFME